MNSHVLAWKHLWRRFDVHLRPAGDGFKLNVPMLLRLHMCHLLQAASLHSIRLNIGVPARFVSGHFLRSDGTVHQQAGHAWAEAYVPDLGWVGFDAANGICTTDAHARVACEDPERDAEDGGRDADRSVPDFDGAGAGTGDAGARRLGAARPARRRRSA